MIRTFALSGLIAFMTWSAAAQTTLHFREGQRVEPQEVTRILDHVDGRSAATRSIRLLQGDGDGAATTSSAATPDALSLPVQFEFDSSTLLPAAHNQLDALADGIKRLPPDRRVVIEGHTDARGPDDYNERLSLRRAAAVKAYLVRTHGIDAARLQDVGFGRRRPISEADPFAAANRRVQFHGA